MNLDRNLGEKLPQEKKNEELVQGCVHGIYQCLVHKQKHQHYYEPINIYRQPMKY